MFGSSGSFGLEAVCTSGSLSKSGLNSASSSGVSTASDSVSAGLDAASSSISGCSESVSGALTSGLLLGAGSASSSVFSESVPTES